MPRRRPRPPIEPGDLPEAMTALYAIVADAAGEAAAQRVVWEVAQELGGAPMWVAAPGSIADRARRRQARIALARGAAPMEVAAEYDLPPSTAYRMADELDAEANAAD